MRFRVNMDKWPYDDRRDARRISAMTIERVNEATYRAEVVSRNGERGKVVIKNWNFHNRSPWELVRKVLNRLKEERCGACERPFHGPLKNGLCPNCQKFAP